jgi:hypothetical protein
MMQTLRQSVEKVLELDTASEVQLMLHEHFSTLRESTTEAL